MAQPFGRDNINPHSDYYVHREQKAKEILHQVRLRGAVLVRAGFFSGKSSFIHSIKREAKPIYEDRVYSLDAVKLARKFKDVWPKDFAEVIKEGTRMSGTEMSTEDFDHACDFASSKKPTLFIIDEVQVLYKCAKTHQDFWEYTIKEIVSEYGKAKQNHPPTTARFIFLGAYNFTPGPDQTIANTFASFTADYGARWLSFARDELSELLERAGANMFSHKIVFEASTIDFILNITGGHVGFNILGLECLQDVEKALRSSGEMTTIDILAVYSGKAFRRAIQSPRLRWNDAIFTKSTEKAIVRYLLCQTDKKCSWAQLKRKFPGEGTGPSDDLTALISRSVIQKLDDRSSAAQEYGFPSPVLASLLCEIVLQTTETDYLIEPKNIYDFIRQILPNFNFRALAKTHSTGTGGLVYERALQMEFNRCAVRALGVDYDCCPDVGYKWKSDGYLDFYIDSGEFQWGIEILRNSVQLVQHCNRKDEIYSPIPMKAYVVLNFVELRSGSPSEHLHKIPQPKLEEQEIRVIWTPRETHFVVLQAGWEAEKTDFNIVEDKLMQEVANGLLAALRQDGGRP